MPLFCRPRLQKFATAPCRVLAGSQQRYSAVVKGFTVFAEALSAQGRSAQQSDGRRLVLRSELAVRAVVLLRGSPRLPGSMKCPGCTRCS
jgi:hypothetical protein